MINIVPSTPQEYDIPASPNILGYMFQLNNGSYYANWEINRTYTWRREEAEIYDDRCITASGSHWGHKSLGHWVVVYEQVS